MALISFLVPATAAAFVGSGIHAVHVDNKHLGAALAFAQRLQKERDEKALVSRAVTSRQKKRIRAAQAECVGTADRSSRPV
jgi:hypothetical protein